MVQKQETKEEGGNLKNNANFWKVPNDFDTKSCMI